MTTGRYLFNPVFDEEKSNGSDKKRSSETCIKKTDRTNTTANITD